MRSWPDLAIEAVFRAWPEGAAPVDSPTRLASDFRERIEVEWPSTYQWPPARIWGDQYRDALRRFVRVQEREIDQAFKGTILTRFRIDGRWHDVAFDYSDWPENLEESCVKRSLVTFKAQYAHGGYGYPNVVPAGYLPSSPLLYRMLPYLRWLHDVRARKYEVYGRFGLQFGSAIRTEALGRLRSSSRFKFEGGGHKVRYSRHLREVARAFTVVDLPGNGPFCFRLVEYLAIGACVIAYPHRSEMPAPLASGDNIIYVRDDLVDLESQCERYLRDSQIRNQIESRAREFFDRFLHRDQLGQYFLKVAISRSA